MLKKIGSWVGSVKKYISNVQNEVSSISKETFDNDENDNAKNKETKVNDDKK